MGLAVGIAMSWDTVTLGDFIEIRHGFAFESQYYSDEGHYILLTPGNCRATGGLKLKGAREKYYTGEIPEEYLLSRGDLLVVMTDLVNHAPILGGAFIIPEDNRFLHNQRLGLVNITDDRRIHKEFLYYLFNTNSYRGQVRGSASGATVRHTSPTRIGRCQVSIPDIAEQTRIAGILTAYDDLIENNQRRIQLLEQSARLLYKEWFVHLRFPGHELVKIKNGVPEGWERKPLGEIAPLNYGRTLRKDDRHPGSIPVYGSSGVVGTHNRAEVHGPTIIVGRKGNVGSVHWSSEDCCAIDTVYYVQSENCSLRLYHALQAMPFISTDVAVPGLNREYAHSCQILTPSSTYHHLFERTVYPFRQQIDNLHHHTGRIALARDLLLPRLMGGMFT